MVETRGDRGIGEPLLAKRHEVKGKKHSTSSIEQPTNSMSNFPEATWVWARHDEQKRKFPQTIAHRGYKAVYPENTLRAFEGAVEVGAHALETDIHLTKDDVVVLSHDADLKRCFGRTEKIIDCDWSMVSELRTIKEPPQPMPRLSDLLEYLSQPEQQHLWLLLDIKIDNDADKVMRLIAQTLASVHPGKRKWEQRVVLGIWVAKFLPLCSHYLPGYPISHIGFSTVYARQFLKVPNVSFNMLQKTLFGPVGRWFIRDVRAAGRPLFLWTVNEVNLMKWAVQKEVDGVITDDPKLFNKVCDEWKDDEPKARPSTFQWLYTFWLYIMITFFGYSFRKRFPETVEKYLIKSKDVREQASIALGS